jgi:transcriptional regulator with XRE-family HTH domain
MPVQRFRDRLEQEFQTRRGKNALYSLRAFAAFLGTDHSTLSQILKGDRPVPLTHIRGWARKLGIVHEEAAVYLAVEHIPDATASERHAQMLHWTAEAQCIVSERAHWEILRRLRPPGFQADSRWLAKEIGVDVDQVNMAMSRLLRLGLLEVVARGKWRDHTGLRSLTESQFRKLALHRVREKAAEFHVKLRRMV